MTEEIGFWKWLTKNILNTKHVLKEWIPALIEMKYYIMFFIFSFIAINVCSDFISDIVTMIFFSFSVVYLFYIISQCNIRGE